MKKKNKMRWVAAILSLFMILGLVNYVMSSASAIPEAVADENDITKFVDIKLNDFYFTRRGETKYFYQNGEVNETGSDDFVLNHNERMGMKFLWTVSKENMPNVKTGKYFKVKLPSKEALLYNFRDVVEVPGIGSFVIENDGYVKFTFNGDFESNESITDGVIEIIANLVAKYADRIEFNPKEETSSSTIKMQIKTTVPNTGGSGSGINPGVIDYSKEYTPLNPKNILQKELNQLNGSDSNHVQYTFRVNYKDIEDTYKKGLHNKQFLVKKNAYMIDDNPPSDLMIDIARTDVTVYFRAAVIDQNTKAVTEEISKMFLPDLSASASYDPSDNTVKFIKSKKVLFKIEENTQGEPWNEFVDRIKKRNPERVVGIWNKNKIVATFGDLPLKDINYEDLFGTTREEGKTKFEKLIDEHATRTDDRKLNQAQIEYLKKAYIGKEVLNFTLRFRAVPKGSPKPFYKNTATMYWDEGQEAKHEADVYMVLASGSAQMQPFKGEFKVTKEWLGVAKDEIKVQLYKNNKVHGEPVTLTPSNLTHTFTGLNNENGRAVFTVKEVNVPENYRSEVVEVDNEFAAVIKNYEQREITLTKKWLDEKGDVLTNPNIDSVTFYLHNENEINPTEKNALRTIVLEKDSWTKTVKVDKTDDLGNEIVYKVSEKIVDGFNQVGEAEGNMTEGFVITNQKEKKAEEAPTLTTDSGTVTPVAAAIIPTKIPTVSVPEVVIITSTLETAIVLPAEPILPVIPTEPIAPVVPAEPILLAEPFLPVEPVTPVVVVPELVSSSNEPVAEISNPPFVSTYPLLPVITNDDTDNEERPNIISNVAQVVTNETPELPSIEESEEGDEMDLEILGDNIPRGDTTISPENSESKPSKKKVVKEKETELNIDKDKTPKGNQKLLALTGGLQTVFLPIFGMLLVLVIAFLTVQFMIKKDR